MGKRVEVALLGPVQVRVAGGVVPLSSLSQRVLLARLTLSRRRVVTVPELVDTLWIDDPPTNAIGNLHSYISRLRRVVGGDRIVRETVGYRIQIDDEDVDLGRVERLVGESRSYVSADPDRAAVLLGDALEIWRGEPLSDVGDPLVFAPELARLGEYRRQLREEWFELRLSAGHGRAALPEIEAAATADPSRERLHLLWMRSLHQSGRTAEALAVADRFRRRLAEESGLDPSPDMAALQRRLLADDPDLRAHPRLVRRASTPLRRRAPGDRFVGRAGDLSLVRTSLDDHRVVTVVGPGGVGKTRLVLELLQRQHGPDRDHDRLLGRAYVVELGEISSPTEIVPAVAATLGVRAAPAGGRTAIADRLARESVLLVVDNCEHLLAPVRDLIADLLERSPGLRVLATSRQRLGLADEQVIGLGPLPEADQVELFCDRASLLRADFDASPQARAVAGEICRLLDGLPLAVELAARREAVFGLSTLRDRLSAGLDVLEPARDRNRSTAVTATVEWSYRLLDPDAQALFDRLAVCRGGFPLDAVDHLAPVGAANPTALLAELVDASLALADLSADPPRYRLLEVMRHVGLSHLTAADTVDAQRAHARWIRSCMETIHRAQCARSAEATQLLRRETGNVQTALSWLIDSERWDEAGRLGVPLALALSDEPHLALLAQLRRLEPPSVAAGSDADCLRAIAAGAAASVSGDADIADPLLTAALDGLAAGHHQRWIGRFFRLMTHMFTGDAAGVEADTMALREDAAAPGWIVATGVCCAALINLFAGDLSDAQRWMLQERRLLDEVSRIDGFVAYTRGELAARTDPESALAWFTQAYRHCDAQGHTYNREVAGIGRTAVLIRLGRHGEAVVACHTLIGNLRRAGMWPQVWIVLRLAAELLVALGDPEPAALLLAAADTDPLAPAVLAPDVDRQDRLWAQIADQLPPAALATARRECPTRGRAGTVQTALAALDRHR